MSRFVHLHNHSDYSLLDGAVQISSYVNAAKEAGMKHIGLTDHGNLFGALRFEQACHQAGINPVVGCEVYVAPGSRFVKPNSGYKNFHLVLYCMNETGYRNLTKMVSSGYTEGFYYKPRIDDGLLEKYHEGLIASSGCLAGEIPRMITDGKYEEAVNKALYYNDLFGQDHFYLELMDHGIPEEKSVIKALMQMSKETGIPLIATNDIHYLRKDHANAQDILICIETGKKKSDAKRLRMDTYQEFYFKSEEEMAALFPEAPEALENTIKLAEMCNLTIPQPGPILPEYFIPEDFDNPNDYLRHLVEKGLTDRYGEITEEIRKRTEYEIGILFQMGFTGYFLIVWDFIHWAKIHDIPVGPGRGSGAGSIIAYALGITDIDPLKYDLLFERFLNPERVSMPDFDVDFCFERRQEVIDYVNRKYGWNQVGGICTFGTLKTKAVLKDVARVLDIPFAESNQITKLVPEGKTPDGRKINAMIAMEVEPKLKEFYDRGGIYKELFEVASILEGQNRHVSTHACGKVIGNTNLTDYVPLYKDQKTGEVTSEFTMDIIEPCGLVKMDFLGLKTLTLLKNTEKLIRKHTPNFNIDEIRDDDEATYKMLSAGKSTAVFQFESAGMQKILKDAQPNNIEDLIALNALYRPGPMQYIPQFIAGKKDPSTIKYPNPDLEELLKPTYGVIVYQEQVMKVAQIIGGFSLGKADILRRAMGKKKVKDMEKMKVEFIDGAREKGYDPKHAEYIFDMLEPFAGYGFNKSHAAAYSVVAYKTAYCKANYPAEFMAANLTNEINSPDAFKEYMSAAADMKIEILPPDINNSNPDFNVVDGKIFYGFLGIKGMGGAAVESIVNERNTNGPYKDFIDFLERVDLRTVNRKVLEVSIESGLFDSIETRNRATLLHNLDQLMEIIQKKKESSRYGQSSLFDDCEEEVAPEISFTEVEAWDSTTILEKEKENLGFYFSGHPLDSYKNIWETHSNLDLAAPEKGTHDKEYTLVGRLSGLRTILTKKGTKMAFGTLEDFDGSIDLTFFSRTYEEFQHLLLEDAVIVVTGKLETKRSDKASLKVFKVQQTNEMQAGPRREKTIHIDFENREFSEDQMIDFRSLIQSHPGNSPVFLHLLSGNQKVTIKASSQISLLDREDIIEEIEEHPLVASLWHE